jgi:hypothetical protein
MPMLRRGDQDAPLAYVELVRSGTLSVSVANTVNVTSLSDNGTRDYTVALARTRNFGSVSETLPKSFDGLSQVGCQK